MVKSLLMSVGITAAGILVFLLAFMVGKKHFGAPPSTEPAKKAGVADPSLSKEKKGQGDKKEDKAKTEEKEKKAEPKEKPDKVKAVKPKRVIPSPMPISSGRKAKDAFLNLSQPQIDELAKNLQEKELLLDEKTRELARREKELDGREEDLEERRDAVRSIQDQVIQAREELGRQRNSFQEEIVTLGKGEEKAIKGLAELVTEMKAEKAAQVLEGMLNDGGDKKKIVKILVAMEASAAAKVTGSMKPESAQQLIRLMLRYRDRSRGSK